MAKIITTRKDAEEAFDVLFRSQEIALRTSRFNEAILRITGLTRPGSQPGLFYFLLYSF